MGQCLYCLAKHNFSLIVLTMYKLCFILTQLTNITHSIIIHRANRNVANDKTIL